jgi:LmbE family N-acetylglucosaminyl deacetylase
MKSSSGAVAALLAGLAAVVAPATRPVGTVHAQTAGAGALDQLVSGLTVTGRVLVVSARPEDEDNRLIAWLSRGRHVETAVLALTRGESAPNFLGEESGIALGAIRTQEMLAARRIDGAEQFFTHAFDFGFARDTNEVFARWNRDSIVGDIVSIIRSFRPQVIIVTAPDSAARADGQRAALAGLAREAFGAAGDAHRYPAVVFGTPWRVAKLYRYGAGLRIRTDEFDRVLGTSYDAVARKARAQYRSQGLLHVAPPSTPIELQRLASLVNDTVALERSIFDGIDTTLSRFAAAAPPNVASALPQLATFADSARRSLDLRNPSAAIAPLASLARLVTNARAAIAWCAHPARSSVPPPTAPAKSCDQAALDLEASIDLMRQRATDALLDAAGVEITAMADRELVAASDSAMVAVTVANHGPASVTLGDLAIWGSTNPSAPAMIVPNDGVIYVTRSVAGLAELHPWWIASRSEDRFPATVPSPLDGLDRGQLLPANLGVRSGAVPENYRRTSDVSVAVTVDDATVTTSIGPIVYDYADAVVGRQLRPIAGAPDVLLNFGRGLDWIVARKPVTRELHLFMRSTAASPRTFVPAVPLIPHGLRVDSLPARVRLGANEQRDLAIHLRGRSLVDEREPFGFVGTEPPAGKYTAGYQTIQYPNLLPIRIARSSGLWVQPVDVVVPPGLSVVYVRGIGDDVPTALRQVGVTLVIVPAEDFLTIDITKINTVVFGASAIELHPELAAQRARLLDFVRSGGTVVLQRGGLPTLQWLPTPAGVIRPLPERITRADAPVVVEEPASSVLTWPNQIRPDDWQKWVGARAELVPSSAGGSKPLEIHDPGQLENRNSLIVWHLGKGAFVYSALTLDQQIGAGVPGALRLLVNLMSAGIAPARPLAKSP